MYTLLLLALLWVALAAPAALLLGRGLRLADERDEAARTSLRIPDFVPDDLLNSLSAPRREA
jgi:hypothetical protein